MEELGLASFLLCLTGRQYETLLDIFFLICGNLIWVSLREFDFI